MKRRKLLVVPLFVTALLVLFVVAHAQSPGPVYQLLTTIQIPGMGGIDISWVDPGSQRFYLADHGAGTGKGQIDVIDTQQMKLLYSIPGLVTGNGVVAIPQMNQLWVGDGDSTVKVVDLAKQTIVATISTGGKARADELGYDPLDHVILIANASDRPPFLTFISADTQKVLGQVTYPSTQIGLEQPVWSKLTRRFYVTVPSSSVTPGSIDVYNAVTMQREQSFPVWGCSPAGLALTPNQHLMTSCGVVVEGRLGGRIATVFGVGGDEIWYNPGDNRYYIGAAVVDADTNQVIATLPVPAGLSVRNASVDSETNRVFAPATNAGVPAGVLVFAQQ